MKLSNKNTIANLSIVFLLFSSAVYGFDNINIVFTKNDSSRETIEENFLLVQPQDKLIHYVNKDKKGEARALLPGELEELSSAIMSQLAGTNVDFQAKPENIPYSRLYIEYDVGGLDIRYSIYSVNLENKISQKMKNVFQRYFLIEY